MVRKLSKEERLMYDLEKLMKRISNNSIKYDKEIDYSVVSDEGRFEVVGIVFTGSVHTRKSTGVNIVQPIGYEMIDNETGERFYAEKTEAVFLVDAHGSTNAGIGVVKGKNNNGFEGQSVFLRDIDDKVAFTSDERITPVFKLNDKSKVIRPLEAVIELDKCTEALLEAIDLYINKKS